MKLNVACSPHIRSWAKSSTIMLNVLIALVPALVASVLIFGIRALLVVAVCVASAVLAEYLFQIGVKRPVMVGDFSAAVTGTLLAFCLPVSIPLWIAALGSVIAIVVIKQLFGGIGENFANPAATARVVLLLSFGGQMANWAHDGLSSATPLAEMAAGKTLPGLMDMFLGLRSGSLGETCALALILGGVYLLASRIITWHIPVAYLGTVAIFALLLGQSVPYHLMGGGLLLGAFFMATDYSTSPITGPGKLIYGVGCGLITMLIRTWGAYPEGVSFAIVLMNILTPHIDRLTRTMPLGGDRT